jgi:hypothetical protein
MWCSKTHRTAAGGACDGARVLEELGADAIAPAIRLIP